MADNKKYIAIGLLTQADLDRLGDGFRAAIRVENVSIFKDLLQAIDEAELQHQAPFSG